jgi:hypothetical protein
MSTDSFIPEGYEAPTSGGGFTKLAAGDTTLRILSNPFMMWLSWNDGKPTRLQYLKGADGKDNKPAKGAGERDSVKHSWGLVVWNYGTEQIEVFELDKQSLIQGITSYSQNAKWGHPKNYDIVINKSGAELKTEYKLIVEPKTEISQQVQDAFLANPVDLRQLLVEKGNPFIEVAAAAAPVPSQEVKPITPAQAFEASEEVHLPADEIPAGFQSDGKGGIVKKATKAPF